MTSKCQGSRRLSLGEGSDGATWAHDGMRRLSYRVGLGWRCQAYNSK